MSCIIELFPQKVNGAVAYSDLNSAKLNRQGMGKNCGIIPTNERTTVRAFDPDRHLER